jgi:hypothetical protein
MKECSILSIDFIDSTKTVLACSAALGEMFGFINDSFVVENQEEFTANIRKMMQWYKGVKFYVIEGDYRKDLRLDIEKGESEEEVKIREMLHKLQCNVPGIIYKRGEVVTNILMIER